MRRMITVQQKDAYTLQELFDYLPISISKLAKESGINEVTLARIRDGERTRRDTVNKLLLAMSKVYKHDLSLNNVIGINVMVNQRLEKKKQESKNQDAVESPRSDGTK
jgi:predicted transcriptional regulator